MSILGNSPQIVGRADTAAFKFACERLAYLIVMLRLYKVIGPQDAGKCLLSLRSRFQVEGAKFFELLNWLYIQLIFCPVNFCLK